MDDMTRPKRPRDPNMLAKLITDLTTRATVEVDPDASKDAKAVTKGRIGGLKGGKVRANRLTPEQRRTSAQRAAKARWSKS